MRQAVKKLLKSSKAISPDVHQLLDAAWYEATYPDVADSGLSAADHFMIHGWAEGRNPNPLFDTEWYFEQNPDIEQSGINPLVHFCTNGWREGRQPHPLFDTNWYLEQNPDVAAAGVNPLVHYLTDGWNEGRSTSEKYIGAHETHGEHKVRHVGPAIILTENGPDPQLRFKGTVAVHLHLFHRDMTEAFARSLESLPCTFDLFVSVHDCDDLKALERQFSRIKHLDSLAVENQPNRGRDMAPMVVSFGERLRRYDLVFHLHSKKSDHTPGKRDWGQQLRHHLLHSSEHMVHLLNLFADDLQLGLVFPVYHKSVTDQVSWGTNFDRVSSIMGRLGSHISEESLEAFPAGSFFVIRAACLRPILDLQLTLDDFEAESGQIDGTLAHALERMWPIVVKKSGFRSTQVMSAEYPRKQNAANNTPDTNDHLPSSAYAPIVVNDPNSYETLYVDVLNSGLWDERWYLSQYYQSFMRAKKARKPQQRYTPLDHYLLEGWRQGHEPSERLPVDVDQDAIGCSKIEYFLNWLRFAGYHFNENIWHPPESAIARYQETSRKRRASKVIYTCISGGYNELLQHFWIADDWDYVCFTDDANLLAAGQHGIWEIRPLVYQDESPTRSNRWHKMHPHSLFPEHEESIYIDGNINILTDYLVSEIERRDDTILLPEHFARNCIYDEIEVLNGSHRISEIDKVALASQKALLRSEAFPSDYGLAENNLIYRRHHDCKIITMMSEWWDIYSRYSSRDQASLAFVFWKNGISFKGKFIANCRINYRDFWMVTHESYAAKRSMLAEKAVKPAFSSDSVAVVLSTNEAFIPYLGVAVYSLIKNARKDRNYDIIILASSIPNDAFSSIIELANGRDNISVRIYDTSFLIGALPRNLFHVEGYVPVETYNKCFITDIMSGYDRCLYLDSDILVLDDVGKLYDFDLEGNAIGASANVANINAAYCGKEIKGRRFDEYLLDELEVQDRNKYFQAGVLILDLNKLSAMELPRRSLAALKKIKKPIFFDQCIFNHLFYGNVAFFSTRWNHVWYMQQYSYLRGSVPDKIFFDYARGRAAPLIVHYAGGSKPQNKLGWTLSDRFWSYAVESPFFNDIKADVKQRETEVAPVIDGFHKLENYRIEPRVLVHLHLYYKEQWPFMAEALRNISSCKADLFVTVVDGDVSTEAEIRSEWPNAQILRVENAGYDIFPFIQVLRKVRLSEYEFILKVHTKNARSSGQDSVYGIHVPGHAWRDELVGALLSSKETFERNLERFANDENLGMLGASRFIFSTLDNSEEETYSLAKWRENCGLSGGNKYVGGSMFLARAYPFERLNGLSLKSSDFDSGKMKTKDYKNKAHIFERLFGIFVENEGLSVDGS